MTRRAPAAGVVRHQQASAAAAALIGRQGIRTGVGHRSLGGMTSVCDTLALTPPLDRAAMHDRPAPDPAAEALAVGAVLFRAHDAARHLENLLELEAADPRVAELMRDAKRVRKSIAALLVDVAMLLVDVAIDMTPEPVTEA